MARRHSNGEGTTYQRKDGRWEGAVYVLTTSGVRKRVRVYGATRAEAHKKLTEAKAKNDQGIPAADKSWKLGDYLDYWLAEVVQRTKRPKTYEQYELICRLNLKPVLGHHTLAGLSVKAVQGFLNEQAAEGHYSSRRIEMMRNTLSAALRRAMREELISRNVARLVELPRAETQASEVIPWTIEEAQQFLATAQHHRLHAAFVLALFYGMRRGEVLGLRWQDIDFVEGTFDVRQQLQDVKGKIEVGPLKTNASRRGLPLIKVAADALVVLRDLTGSLGVRTRLGVLLDNRNALEPTQLRQDVPAALHRSGRTDHQASSSAPHCRDHNASPWHTAPSGSAHPRPLTRVRDSADLSAR